MPFPSGINDPAVRAAWLAERRRKVEAFERLVANGIPKPHAARALGTSVSGIRAMRHSIEGLEEGKHVGRSIGAHIDLGLALLSCLLMPGESLTSEDMAAWCGCSKSAIQSIERRALAKVRQRLVENLGEPAVAREIQSLLTTFGRAA